METKDSIYFYSHNDNFGYMSNFYPSEFVDSTGNKFECSEQYLMYWKAKTFEPENAQLLEKFLTQSSPYKLKALGRQVKNYDDIKWNQIRLGVMISGWTKPGVV